MTGPISAPDGEQSTNQRIAQHYDESPYDSDAFAFSSPLHIQAVARLYGISSIDPERARVLEIGCASGGNLLPFAVTYPNARVVGIDLSVDQIERGKRVVQSLGVQNIELMAMDLLDIDEELGEFDYILAHGVFSWVPPKVREGLLRVCRKNLSKQGVAFLSYNTYPGWKAGDIVRDAILFHSHGASTEQARLACARAVIGLLNDGLSTSNLLAPAVRTITGMLEKLPDYYIAHEYLEAFNSPCYLIEFADLAMQSGMAYVGDTEPHLELAATYGQNVQLSLSLIAMGQPKVMRQQYLDFLVGQNFRKSMLVHQERQSEIAVQPDLAELRHLRFSARFDHIDSPPNAPSGQRSYRDHKQLVLHVSEAAWLQVMDTLTQAWPRSLSMEQIRDVAELSLSDVERAIRFLFGLGRLNLTLAATAYDRTERRKGPEVIPGISRLFALKAKGEDAQIGIYNLWHSKVTWVPSAPDMFVLQLMDGSRDEFELRSTLRDALHQGIVPGPHGKFLKGQRNLDSVAQRMLHSILEALRVQGLLLN